MLPTTLPYLDPIEPDIVLTTTFGGVGEIPWYTAHCSVTLPWAADGRIAILARRANHGGDRQLPPDQNQPAAPAAGDLEGNLLHRNLNGPGRPAPLPRRHHLRGGRGDPAAALRR